jgi:hypothetical protein
LKGKLKIRVMASDFDTTLAALEELENQLPDGASMAEINIKMSDSIRFIASLNCLSSSSLE